MLGRAEKDELLTDAGWRMASRLAPGAMDQWREFTVARYRDEAMCREVFVAAVRRKDSAARIEHATALDDRVLQLADSFAERLALQDRVLELLVRSVIDYPEAWTRRVEFVPPGLPVVAREPAEPRRAIRLE